MIAAIDPGNTGALALLGCQGSFRVYDCPLKDKQIDPEATIHLMRSITPIDVVVIERSVAFGMGRTSAFNYGCNFATWITASHAIGKSPVFVYPAQWTKDLGKEGTKDASLELARTLIPQAKDVLTRKKDNGRADALLIAYWYQKFGVNDATT